MMATRKPTLDDVAALARVSRITVDRVLNKRGMVSARTEERVLAAARALNLDRALSLVPTRILRVGVVLQNDTNHYYVKLRQTFARAQQQYARFNIRISFHYYGALNAAAVGTTVAATAETCDALIVVLFDDPDVVALVRALARKMPVVTLASDLPQSGRLRYVGSDARAEGRTAAGLIGKFLEERGGEVVIVTGHAGLTEHAQREAGFREALAAYPCCRIVRSYQSFEADDGGRAIAGVLREFPSLRAIYNMSVGSRSIVATVTAMGRRAAIVAHTLTPETLELLESGAVAAVIDRDIDLDVRRTLEIILAAAGRLEAEAVSAPQMPQIFIRENARRVGG